MPQLYDANDETKTNPYRLQDVINQIKREDILILEDLNAKISGNNTGKEQVMRKKGSGVMNENGKLFTDFCSENDLQCRLHVHWMQHFST